MHSIAYIFRDSVLIPSYVDPEEPVVARKIFFLFYTEVVYKGILSFFRTGFFKKSTLSKIH